MSRYAEALKTHPKRVTVVTMLILLVSYQLIILAITSPRATHLSATHLNPSASSSFQVGTTVFWRPVSPTHDSRTFQGDVQRTGDYGPIGPNRLRLNWAFIGAEQSPIVANGIAYTYTVDNSRNQATIYALNALTGRVRWKLNLSGAYPTADSFSIDNGLLYFSTDNGIYALDASTGARRWAYGPLQSAWWLTVYGNLVFVPQDNTILALRAIDGHKLWTYTVPIQTSQSSDHYFNFLPAAGRGTIYLPNDDGRLYAIDSTNGKCIWKANIGEYLSYPLVVNDVVFIAHSQGSSSRLSAFSTKSGKKVWDSTVISLTGNNSFPAVGAGMLFIGDDFGTVYGMNARTGAKNWSRWVGGSHIVGLAVAGGRVYVSSDEVEGRNGTVFVLNQATGVIEDSFNTGRPYISEPVVAGGAMYVTSSEETVGTSVLYAVG